MKLKFLKYEGAGNDFILIDNRSGEITLTVEQIVSICNRNKGVGGDGIILIENHPTADFYMRYYNSDGSEVGMCGNGGRCISLFAHHLGIGSTDKYFYAKDGAHAAKINCHDESSGEIEIKLIDVLSVVKLGNNKYFLNSGVPHYVEFVDNIKNIDVRSAGSQIRYSKEFEAAGGTNANFVEIINDNKLLIRTYERGVENETLACGTGAAAAAIAFHNSRQTASNSISIKTLGGELKIDFGYDAGYKDVRLTGEARLVFKGEINII